jgi:hypothetical protein
MPTPPPDRVSGPIGVKDDLAAECSALTRHLVGVEPGGYVVSQYLRAHEAGSVGEARSSLDRLLVDVARRGPTMARIADTYAVLFQKHGLLRRKLVLLLAILESYGKTAPLVDRTGGHSLAAFVALAAFKGIGFALFALVAIAVITPLRFLGGGSR